jgi:radical SAM superfamily enzyme YgiQ (UPF0313 family)
MKIVLLNPPNFDSLYVNRDLMGSLGVNNRLKEKPIERLMSFLKARSIRLPVMSLVYSATVLAKDFDVEVIDAANLELSEAETLRRIEELKPDMIISSTSISTLMHEVQFVFELKKRLGIKVGLIGDAAVQLSRHVFDRFAVDFIIKGSDPEFALLHLAEAGTYEKLSGVIFREGGSVRDRDIGELATTRELDSLPFPKWELFPIKSYRYFPILRRAPFVPVLSTRGCPYGCIYCPYTSNQGVKNRYRSPQNVIDELMVLKQKYGVSAVQFRDPTFTLKMDRTLAICEGIAKRGIDIEWGCETRVDRLTEDLVDRMFEVGLRGVNIGIESTAPEVISNVDRGWIDPNHIRKLVRHMSDKGIRVSGFFILGLPGDTRKTIEGTLNFAMELPLSYAEFKIATPFPGTPLFDLAKRNRWIEEVRIEQFTSYYPSMRISDELDPDYLKDAASNAYRTFYTQPSRLLKELSSSSFISGLLSLALH